MNHPCDWLLLININFGSNAVISLKYFREVMYNVGKFRKYDGNG